MKRTVRLLLPLLALLLRPASGQVLIINEFMASNSSVIKDPDYQAYADWIELYNPGDTAVHLNGWTITDDLSAPAKYAFTGAIIVPAHARILIWADDHATGTHTNFKLSASGEAVGLFGPSGALVDTVTFGAQANDVSRGRYPDGAAAWYAMSPSSPGAANSASGIVDRLTEPHVAPAAGFHAGPVTVTLSHPVPGVTLRYTRDGHTPTTQSPAYTVPVAVETTQVLRVRAFKDGMLPSRTVTSTYFIDEPTDLPVVSLTTDPENFFSDTSGIYVIGTNGILGHCSTAPRNWNQEWERPADIELFEKDRARAFAVSAGVQIYGGCTRLYPQKSLAFYFRGDYGDATLPYRLFPSLPITVYDNFILRSSGQDWWRTMFRDGMVQTLFRGTMDLDGPAYRPAVLFLNGQYWGIHNLREKLNEHFVEAHHGVSGDNIDLIEISKEVSANNGDAAAYNAMIAYLTNNSPSAPEHYTYLSSIIDMDEYIDYQIAQIYGANGDWPGSNMKLWRERSPAGKWRWMIYDLDFTFGGNAQGQYSTNTLAQATATNGPSWPNPPWSTLMLRRLLENAGFRNEFIQRYAVHLNTTFAAARVHAVIDSLALAIANEIPRHKQRWPQSISLDAKTWTGNIQIMKDFAQYRPDTSRKHFVQKFGLPGLAKLIISRNDPQAGRIFTHTVEVTGNGSSNIVFRGVPLRLKAQAMPGYRFVRWEGAFTSAAAETSVLITANAPLTAVFAPDTALSSAPVINEINYRSSPVFDTEDWVELFNPSPSPVNLAGWAFGQGNGEEFVLPAGASIAARGYLVLSRDTARFRALHPSAGPLIGNLPFGLSSAGERLRLFTAVHETADDVTYMPGAPWASSPNGGGPTLSLMHPSADNTLATSWKASKPGGTPGVLNDVYAVTAVTERSAPDGFALLQNYPNPFNPATVIVFRLPKRAPVMLTVYNRLGQTVRRLVEREMEAGEHRVPFDASGLASGVYFYELTTPSFRSVRKSMVVK